MKSATVDKLKKELQETRDQVEAVVQEFKEFASYSERRADLLEEDVSEVMKALCYNVEKSAELEKIYVEQEEGQKHWWLMSAKVPEGLATEIAETLGYKNPAPRPEDEDDTEYTGGWTREKWSHFLDILAKIKVKRMDAKSRFTNPDGWARSKQYFVIKLNLSVAAVELYEHISRLDSSLAPKKKLVIYSAKTRSEKRKIADKKWQKENGNEEEAGAGGNGSSSSSGSKGGGKSKKWYKGKGKGKK